MDTFTVKIELPREILDALDISTTEATQRAQEWVILELYRESTISSGKAAQSLGISKAEFMTLLSKHEIPYLDLNPAELDQDVRNASAAVTRR